jgi:hypothetical protein
MNYSFPLPRNGAQIDEGQSADVKAALDGLRNEFWSESSDGAKSRIIRDYPLEWDEWCAEWQRGDRNAFASGDRVIFRNVGHDTEFEDRFVDMVGTVERPLRPVSLDLTGERDTEVGPMYVVRFGNETIIAFEDELTRVEP